MWMVSLGIYINARIQGFPMPQCKNNIYSVSPVIYNICDVKWQNNWTYYT